MSNWQILLDTFLECNQSYIDRMKKPSCKDAVIACVSNLNISQLPLTFINDYKKDHLHRSKRKSQTDCIKLIQKATDSLHNGNVAVAKELMNISASFSSSKSSESDSLNLLLKQAQEKYYNPQTFVSFDNIASENTAGTLSQIILNYQRKLGHSDFTTSDAIRAFQNDRLLSEMNSFKPHPSHYGLSNCLSIHYNKEEGRHVKCNRGIKAGQVLFQEDPVAFVVVPDFKFKVCHQCLKPPSNIVPCELCNEVIYCSQRCRDDAKNSYHQFECGYFELLQSVGIAQLAIRCLIVAGNFDVWRNQYLRFQKNICQSARTAAIGGYESLYFLEYHPQNLSKEELIQYALTATLLATYLRSETNYLPVDVSDELFIEVTETLLRHILQLVCNAHAIVFNITSDGSDGDMNVTDYGPVRVATAIYPTVSMMNHACKPNIINNFLCTRIIVKAATALKPGDEVLNCYGPHFARMPTNERKQVLWEQYGFHCKCNQCCQPLDHVEKFRAFKCPVCRGPLSTANYCLICKHARKIPDELFQSSDKLADFFSTAGEANVETIYNRWNDARKFLHCANWLLLDGLDVLVKRLLALQSYPLVAKIVQSSLSCVLQRFGECSLEMNEECWKLLSICERGLANLAYGEVSSKDRSELKQVAHETSLFLVRLAEIGCYQPEAYL